eukprot:4253187-Amphidinium_carterae.1
MSQFFNVNHQMHLVLCLPGGHSKSDGCTRGHEVRRDNDAGATPKGFQDRLVPIALKSLFEPHDHNCTSCFSQHAMGQETHNPSGESFSQNQSGPRLDEVVLLPRPSRDSRVAAQSV